MRRWLCPAVQGACAPHLKAGTGLRRSTSREAAEYGSQGQARSARPWIVLDKIPRPEGAQYSVARFAGSVITGTRSPGYARPDTSGLAHPGLPSAAAPRLIDADIRVHSFVWFVLSSRRIEQSLAADGAIACFPRDLSLRLAPASTSCDLQILI
jgi:hypothetical protein